MAGTIINGPVAANGKVWWLVEDDWGGVAWIDEAALAEAYFPPPESAGGWRSLIAPNTTPTNAQIASVRNIAGLDWKKLKLASNYSNSLSAASAVIVIRNGWIGGEWGSTSSFMVASITKSLTSLALGKLLYIDLSKAGQLASPISPESAVHQYLPAAFANSNALKREIKLQHFMTMSSGIKSADSSAFSLTLDQALTYPMSTPPGQRWSYVSLPVNLLSIIVQNLSGQSLRSFFATRIAGPIGASISSWGTWAGYIAGATKASITARNLARIGYLALRQGQWDNGTGIKQIISSTSLSLLTTWASFLATTNSFESVTPFFAPDPESDSYYGHLFWTNRTKAGLGERVPADAYYMHGFRDNLCIVIPSLDMIVVRLAASGPGMDPTFRSEFMSRIMAAVR
jgi:CubicO group peptidase (beta-lactamase class C family)